MPDGKAKPANRWEDWSNLFLAIWLFISPWTFGFTTSAAAAWNAWIVAVIVGLVAASALYQVYRWEEWTNVALGIWLAISPWVLGFTGAAAAARNAVLVGLLVLVVAGEELATLPREARLQR